MEFKDRLQQLIDLKKISQRDVARGVEMDPSKVSYWVSGKVKAPRRTTIQKLAQFFGCNIEWLATGEGEPFGKVEMARLGLKILNENSGNTVIASGKKSKASGGKFTDNSTNITSATPSQSNQPELTDKELALILGLREAGGNMLIDKFLEEIEALKAFIAGRK